jgi:hypothetical protein
VTDALTKALLLEEVVPPRAIAEALFVSVTGHVPIVLALTETGAVSHEVLARYLSRSEAPFLRHVVPLVDVIERLPAGMCARLFAIPVRRDAITGTVDVVVADPSDPHPAGEIAFQLQAPVRVVRAPVAAIEEALRKMRMKSSGRPPPPSRPPPSTRPRASRPPAPPYPSPDEDRLFDSRRPMELPHDTVPPPPGSVTNPGLAFDAPRPPDIERRVERHVEPTPVAGRGRRATPPWGTPVHNPGPASTGSEPPSGLGSEIPIPLTRRTFTAVAGGTQRPPPLMNPSMSQLGEGIPVEPGALRAALEVRRDEPMDNMHVRIPRAPAAPASSPELPMHSFIPGPPPLPGAGPYAAYAPQLPFADIGGIMAAVRAAGTRDEVLELVLTAARMVAFKVALFVVKRGGYLGWACTPEFGDRQTLQSILVPLEAQSVFDEAVREGLYLGPIRHDEVHAMLLHVMRSATRDVAVVPIRVSGKTAVIIVADELGDTMVATRRLEEVARAAGEAFTRILRSRR